MNMFHINTETSQSRMIKIQKKQLSFLPVKSGESMVKLEKSLSPDTIKARKLKLRKAAQGFEAIFIRELLTIMNSTVPNGGWFGKGPVGEIYGDMMNNTIAEVMSKRSVLGLSDMIYRQLAGEIETERNIIRPSGDFNLKETVKNDDILNK